MLVVVLMCVVCCALFVVCHRLRDGVASCLLVVWCLFCVGCVLKTVRCCVSVVCCLLLLFISVIVCCLWFVVMCLLLLVVACCSLFVLCVGFFVV